MARAPNAAEESFGRFEYVYVQSASICDMVDLETAHRFAQSPIRSESVRQYVSCLFCNHADQVREMRLPVVLISVVLGCWRVALEGTVKLDTSTRCSSDVDLSGAFLDHGNPLFCRFGVVLFLSLQKHWLIHHGRCGRSPTPWKFHNRYVLSQLRIRRFSHPASGSVVCS